jgi:hypothetical protein
MEAHALSRIIKGMHGVEAKGRKMDWNRRCISKNINII